MSRYRFPNKPILPMGVSIERIRRAVDRWMDGVEDYNPDSPKPKTFKEIIDQLILEDVIGKAQKENNEEEIKEFLDQFSTKIGEDK